MPHKPRMNRRSTVWAQWQVGVSSSFFAATGVSFMVGFFRSIGFSEIYIAAYGSIIGVAGSFCLFGSWFAQKNGQYKSTVCITSLLSVVASLAAVLLGAFGGSGAVIPIFVLLLMALYQLGIYMSTPVLLSWLSGLMKEDEWQGFYSTRVTIADASVLVTALTVGLFLGNTPRTDSFVWVFSLAALLGLISVYLAAKIPSAAVRESYPSMRSYIAMVADAMRKREIRKLLSIAFLRAFAYSLVMPFQPLFLLEDLKFSYATISLLTCLGTVFSVICYKVWARVQRRAGNLTSLRWNLALSVLDPVLWILAVQKRPGTIYLAFALFGSAGAQGIINAGYWTSFLGAVFQYADQRQKPVYTSMYYIVFGAATIVAPMVAGFLVQHFNQSPLTLFGNPTASVNGYRVVFIVTGLLLIVTTIYAAFALRPEKHNPEGKSALSKG